RRLPPRRPVPRRRRRGPPPRGVVHRRRGPRGRLPRRLDRWREELPRAARSRPRRRRRALAGEAGRRRRRGLGGMGGPHEPGAPASCRPRPQRRRSTSLRRRARTRRRARPRRDGRPGRGRVARGGGGAQRGAAVGAVGAAVLRPTPHGGAAAEALKAETPLTIRRPVMRDEPTSAIGRGRSLLLICVLSIAFAVSCAMPARAQTGGDSIAIAIIRDVMLQRLIWLQDSTLD